MEPEETQESQSNYGLQEQSGKHHSPGLKLGYKAIGIKNQSGTGKHRQMDRWDKTEDAEIFGCLTLDRRVKDIHWRQGGL